MRWVTAFGKFWWDFLIGDTPELFVGVLVAVAAVALLCADPGLRRACAAVLPVLVAGLLGLSVWWSARSSRP